MGVLFFRYGKNSSPIFGYFLLLSRLALGGNRGTSPTPSPDPIGDRYAVGPLHRS